MADVSVNEHVWSTCRLKFWGKSGDSDEREHDGSAGDPQQAGDP